MPCRRRLTTSARRLSAIVRSEISVPNGYSAVSPHHEQHYQPPHGMSNQHYAQPVGGYHPGSYMGPAGQYPGQAQMRRKQVRATQACNNCRSRKQKCDEQRPCQFCKENGYECQYRDVPPPKYAPSRPLAPPS